MGIRFYCPNGHKLNVKTELAGKYGICPECGIRMEIPLESTRESEKKQQVEEELRLAGSFSNSDTDQSRFFPTEEPMVSPDHSTEQVSPDASSAGSSVLDEMTVVWYVQTDNGQRFGPATGPIIKTWIEEKRIGPTMLVWREGWPEWLQAKHVFPEVAQLFKPAGGVGGWEKAASPPPVTESQSVSTISTSPKRSSAKSQINGSIPENMNPTNANATPSMFDLGDFGGLATDEPGLASQSTGLGLRSKKKPIENFGLIVGFLIAMLIMLIVLAVVLYIGTRPRAIPKPDIRIHSEVQKKEISFNLTGDFHFPVM